MSGGLDRANSEIGWPLIGLVSMKYRPSTGGTNLPPMKLS